MRTNNTYWLGLGLAAATVLFLFFGIGALGIIGDGGRPDRLYLAVFATVAVGIVLARFRAAGMAVALGAAAAVQAVVTVVALAVYGGDEGVSAVDVVGINALYVVLFAISAWLFLRAASSLRAGPA